MTKAKKRITVIWKDAVIFDAFSKIPKSLPTITTTGILVKSSDAFVILNRTHSSSNQSEMAKPKSSASFFYIPKAMIVKIIEL